MSDLTTFKSNQPRPPKYQVAHPDGKSLVPYTNHGKLRFVGQAKGVWYQDSQNNPVLHTVVEEKYESNYADRYVFTKAWEDGTTEEDMALDLSAFGWVNDFGPNDFVFTNGKIVLAEAHLSKGDGTWSYRVGCPLGQGRCYLPTGTVAMGLAELKVREYLVDARNRLNNAADILHRSLPEYA